MNLNNNYLIAKKELFGICRSLTGIGVRKTLKIIKREIPLLKIRNIKSGTKVFDWNVPPEWNVKNAYVLDKNNNKIIDFNKNNLHLVGYSFPINKKIQKFQLIEHLYSLPKLPNAIPYRTSYYKKAWGFCITHIQKKQLIKDYKDTDKFKVVIDSSFKANGKLTYGELLVPGFSKKEILISTYICHPSMANNELSGIILSMSLANYFLKLKKQKLSIRFVFLPETIGSISFLNKNLNYLKKYVIGGYNLSCVGDDRMHSCMLTKYKNTIADKSLLEAYKKLKIKYKEFSFLERGSDERQYNSPRIDLSIASIFRSKYGNYPEYHTSLDNFKLVTKSGIKGSYQVALCAIKIFIKREIPISIYLCEPQMGKRGLYPLKKNLHNLIERDLMNFIQYADGKNDIDDISKYIKLSKVKTLFIYKLLKKEKIVY